MRYAESWTRVVLRTFLTPLEWVEARAVLYIPVEAGQAIRTESVSDNYDDEYEAIGAQSGATKISELCQVSCKVSIFLPGSCFF